MKKLFAALVVMLVAVLILVGCNTTNSSRSITSTFIDTEGCLLVMYSDGTADNLGCVIGPQGIQGERGEQGDDKFAYNAFELKISANMSVLDFMEYTDYFTIYGYIGTYTPTLYGKLLVRNDNPYVRIKNAYYVVPANANGTFTIDIFDRYGPDYCDSDRQTLTPAECLELGGVKLSDDLKYAYFPIETYDSFYGNSEKMLTSSLFIPVSARYGSIYIEGERLLPIE